MTELLDRLNSALEGRYRLLRELARGGAAIVFVAEDLKHERRVALKVLRPDLAAALGADRFLREIKIAAQLSHPHILPVHDSGEADGFLYYVMPLVEGESLRQRLAREHALPVAEAARLLHDVLDALHHAHQRGVVHRDIKPDNVMISGRHALVTDFGVAKGLSAAAESSVDTSGVALGTPAYMAPEQAAADPGIDSRADIYSIGALAYEMLAGRPPFTGESPQAILAAQVTQDPQPVTAHRVGVPREVTHLVMRCLAKNPDDRWQTAEEVLHELSAATTPNGGMAPVTQASPAKPRANRWRLPALAGVVGIVLLMLLGWFTRGSEDARRSGNPVLVVLPFQNLGPAEDEYFANGVTDAITARLASLTGLGVIARSSAIQYKGSSKSTREIAEEVGADYVLEGTIQREEPTDPTSRVRIIPQLVRVADETQLWANSYDEDMTEVFEVQSDIAERVARAMDLALLGSEGESISAPPTDNIEAYEYYLRGHDYLAGNLGSGDANARRIAVDMFEQAIALDSQFALAYAELSLAHIWLFHYFVDPSAERLASAKMAVDRAVAIDPDLPAAHMALGHYYYWGADSDPERALGEFKLVAEREPNNAYARMLVGVLQAARGEWEEALDNSALAAELDPREPEWAQSAGMFHLMARRYERAEHYLDRALRLAPDMAPAFRDKISLYLRWHGDTERARAVVRQMLSRVTVGEVALALVDVAPVLVASGEYDSLFLQLTPASISGPLPFDYFYAKGEFHRLRGQPQESRAYFDSLLTMVDALPPERAEDPIVSAFRARALAGLGRKAEAMENATKLESLMEQSRDALRAGEMEQTLVWVYSAVGEPEAAIDHLGHLLRVPSLISVPYLRIEQFPGNLNQHPGFQALLKGKQSRPVAS